MKKLLLLLFAVTVLTACSDDDTADGDDRILGNWFLVDWNIPNQDGPSECTQQTNITFYADNTAESEFYSEDSAGDCDLETDTSDWSRESNGQYTFDVPGIGRQTGDVEFDGDDRFTFSALGASITFEK